MCNDERLREVTIGEPTVHGGRIALIPYDPEWPRRFERQAARVRTALGSGALRIEHVGSTSVPGLSAKPFIDIVLEVANSADEAAYVPNLEAAGYVLRIREPKWHEHRLFTSPHEEIKLHVFGRDCPEIRRMIEFRNRLRDHAADRELYARTKRELAQRRWRYVQDYADAKSEVVEAILARAATDVAYRVSGTPDG